MATMQSYVLSMLCVITWLFPFRSFRPNDPSFVYPLHDPVINWTLATLCFWYWCFPFILPRIQQLTDTEMVDKIVKLFWLQIGLYLAVLFVAVAGDNVDLNKFDGQFVS